MLSRYYIKYRYLFFFLLEIILLQKFVNIPLHCLKSVLKIQENINEGVNLKGIVSRDNMTIDV
jgi:hypothetical protein